MSFSSEGSGMENIPCDTLVELSSEEPARSACECLGNRSLGSLVGLIDSFPDIGCEFLLKLSFIDGCESVLDRLFSHGFCDRETDGTNAGERGQEIVAFVLSGRCQFSERQGGSLNHRVGDMPGSGRDRAKGDARENVRVICLINVDFLAVELRWSERASSSDQSPSIGPINQLLRRCFTTGSRVGEWKDDGAGNIFCHGADNLFRESACLPGNVNTVGLAFRALVQSGGLDRLPQEDRSVDGKRSDRSGFCSNS
jgi:hypothetical protein